MRIKTEKIKVQARLQVQLKQVAIIMVGLFVFSGTQGAILATEKGTTTEAAETAAQTDSIDSIETIATNLEKLGVFIGSDQGFELDRQPTRIEGLVMLLRLLGVEEAAKAEADAACAFDDVPIWARGYVNYAYAHGLTKGIGKGRFGTDNPLLAQSFTTLLLRALGYDDTKGDFSWQQANQFGHGIYLLNDGVYSRLQSGDFLRRDMALMTYSALKTYRSKTSQTLATSLRNQKILNEELYVQLKLYQSNDPNARDVLVTIGNESASDSNQPNAGASQGDNIIQKPALEQSLSLQELFAKDWYLFTAANGFTPDGQLPLLSSPVIMRQELKDWAKSRGMDQTGQDLVDVYFEVCLAKGLNPVIQYIQMCLETGWLYKVESSLGLDESFHNPCGLKITNPPTEKSSAQFMIFESWREGIEAHTDHSALYAGVDGYPKADTKDPRHFPYLLGKVTTVEGLGGTWGEEDYHTKIYKLYIELLRFVGR